MLGGVSVYCCVKRIQTERVTIALVALLWALGSGLVRDLGRLPLSSAPLAVRRAASG